ncbi:glycosyl transferase family 90-domain-containing protein [Mycena capillaripes]|nr:glycosyl transferase family 90-domain-containing protein [Mycena capillaripes]
MTFPYEPVPAEPDNGHVLSLTERGENISPQGPKNRIRKARLIICTLAASAAFLVVIVIARHGDRPPKFVLHADDPVAAAKLHVDNLLARQSATYEQAAARYSLKTGRPPPRNHDKWFTFAQAHSCLIDDYDQINRDFAPFYQLVEEDPLFLQRRVDIVADVLREAGVIVIKDGEVHMPQGADLKYWGGGSVTFAQFAHLLPDMSFIINGKDQPRVVFDYRTPGSAAREKALALTDERPFEISPQPTAEFFRNHGCEVLRNPMGFTETANDDSGFFLSSSPAWFTLDLYPVLSVTKVSPCFADIVFPSEYYYHRSPMSPSFAYPDNIAWQDKKPQGYWRGTATGGQIIGSNYRNFTRFKLVDLAHAHPDLVDAKITRFADLLCLQEDGCDREGIIREYNIGGGAPQENIYRYKYALDVDGMTYSGRFLGLLGSGSLVFKATIFNEFFNGWLRPYEHYIPVLPDLSDLPEKIGWARRHDGEARIIQERGREMKTRVMTDAQNDCYFFALLLEWAQLQEISRNAGQSTAGA